MLNKIISIPTCPHCHADLDGWVEYSEAIGKITCNYCGGEINIKDYSDEDE